jgi:hypothetical protein
VTNFDLRNQSVNQQQIAGRDVVQNIVFVGQILDFAKIEGLIPPPEPINQTDILDISATLDRSIKNRLGEDLINATSIVGEILRPAFEPLMALGDLKVFPFRRILPDLSRSLFTSLDDSGLWETFCQSIEWKLPTVYKASYSANSLVSSTTTTIQAILDKTSFTNIKNIKVVSVIGDVVWFESQGELWSRRFGKKRIYGILKPNKLFFSYSFKDEEGFGTLGVNENYIFCCKKLKRIRNQAIPDFLRKIWIIKETGIGIDNFSCFTSDEFRVFITGIVIDFIRLSSIALTDISLWQKILNLIQISKS